MIKAYARLASFSTRVFVQGVPTEWTHDQIQTHFS